MRFKKNIQIEIAGEPKKKKTEPPKAPIVFTEKLRLLMLERLAGRHEYTLVKPYIDAGVVSPQTIYNYLSTDWRNKVVRWEKFEPIALALGLGEEEARAAAAAEPERAPSLAAVRALLRPLRQQLFERVEDFFEGAGVSGVDLLIERLDPHTQYLEVMVDDGDELPRRKPSTVGEFGLAIWNAQPLYIADLEESVASYDVSLDRSRGKRKSVLYLPLDERGRLLEPARDAGRRDAKRDRVFLLLAVGSDEPDLLGALDGPRRLHDLEDWIGGQLYAQCEDLLPEFARLAADELRAQRKLRAQRSDVEVKRITKSSALPAGFVHTLRERMSELGIAMVTLRDVQPSEERRRPRREQWRPVLKAMHCESVLDRIYHAQRDGCLDRSVATGAHNRYFEVLAAVLDAGAIDLEPHEFSAGEPAALPQGHGVSFKELRIPVALDGRAPLAGYVLVIGSSKRTLAPGAALDRARELRDALTRGLKRLAGAHESTAMLEDDAHALFHALAIGDRPWLVEVLGGDEQLADRALALVDELRALLYASYFAAYRIGAELRLATRPEPRPTPSFPRARVIDRFRKLAQRFDPGGVGTVWLEWDRETGHATRHGRPDERALLRLPRDLEPERAEDARAIALCYRRRYVQVALVPRSTPLFGQPLAEPFDPAEAASDWGLLTFERMARTARCEVIAPGDKRALVDDLFRLASSDRPSPLERPEGLAARLRARCPTVTLDLRKVIHNGGQYTEEFCERYNDAGVAEIVAELRAPSEVPAGYEKLRELLDCNLPPSPSDPRALPMLQLIASFVRAEGFRERGKDPTLLVAGDGQGGASIHIGGLKRFAQRASVLVRRQAGETWVLEAYLTRVPFGQEPANLDELAKAVERAPELGGLGFKR